ncbi:MAG: hypothetical protein ABJ360_02890 [Roseobacter sp.]
MVSLSTDRVSLGPRGYLDRQSPRYRAPTSSGFLLSANLVIWTAVSGRYHILSPLIGAVGVGYLSAELRGSLI